MCELSEQSGYSDEGVAVMPPVPYLPPVDLCKLRKCGHMMHRPCFLMMMKSESAKVYIHAAPCTERRRMVRNVKPINAMMYST